MIIDEFLSLFLEFLIAIREDLAIYHKTRFHAPPVNLFQILNFQNHKILNNIYP